MSFMEFLKEYWQVILSAVSVLTGAVLSIISFVKRYKQAKANKDTETQLNMLNELKGVAFGLINIAEHTFSDIPTSGASKLVYVLDNIKKLCEERNMPYEESFWTDFVESMVSQANAVQAEKVSEQDKQAIVEKVKTLVPEFVKEANRMFMSIPNNTRFKIAYVISLIEEACEAEEVNVFSTFDWHSYVSELYNVGAVAQ